MPHVTWAISTLLRNGKWYKWTWVKSQLLSGSCSRFYFTYSLCVACASPNLAKSSSLSLQHLNVKGNITRTHKLASHPKKRCILEVPWCTSSQGDNRTDHWQRFIYCRHWTRWLHYSGLYIILQHNAILFLKWKGRTQTAENQAT